jgi:hypothetical protein
MDIISRLPRSIRWQPCDAYLTIGDSSMKIAVLRSIEVYILLKLLLAMTGFRNLLLKPTASGFQSAPDLSLLRHPSILQNNRVFAQP